MTPTDPGRRDREVVLELRTKTTNAATGEDVLAWAPAFFLWAEWLPAGTREAYQAQQRLEGYIDGVFRIPWLAGIHSEAYRIVSEGVVYDIKPPVERGYHEELDSPVVARVS